MISTLCWLLTVFTVAILFLSNRESRIVAASGVMWGEAVGFGFIAPVLINVHHLHPTALQHWLIVCGLLGSMFAIVGCILAVLFAAPLIGFRKTRRITWNNPYWALGIFVLASIPSAYMATSFVVEWVSFARFPSFLAYASPVAVAVPPYIALLFVLIYMYRRWGSRGGDPRGRLMAAVVTAAAFTAAFALPLRIDAAPPLHTAGNTMLMRESANDVKPPLLVIGLDGGSWRVLRPVIEHGQAPTLARFVREGIQGEIEALWPPYWSTPAWGAIFTGYPQSELGVHEDLAVTSPGLPTFELPLELRPLLNPMFVLELGFLRGNMLMRPAPAPRSLLRRPPVWEQLTRAGVKTAVIRFPFTYPANGQADYVVSNRVVTDFWDVFGVQAGDRESLVSPPAEANELLRWFSDDRVVDQSVLTRLLPRLDRPKPADAVMNPLDVLRTVSQESQRMFGVTEHLLRRHRDLDVVMLHVTALDNICHAFWQYRFPQDFPDVRLAKADIDELGPVVDRYVEFLDARIARLIDAFSERPNVLIVADHGEERSPVTAPWTGWHSRTGIFLAAGPDIPARPGLFHVSYFDIVPTMLDLLDMAKPSDLSGESVIYTPASQ